MYQEMFNCTREMSQAMSWLFIICYIYHKAILQLSFIKLTPSTCGYFFLFCLIHKRIDDSRTNTWTASHKYYNKRADS